MKVTHLTKLIILLMVCIAIIGCEKDHEETGTIYGIVTDFSTGEPVSSANVQLRPSGETALTGTDGMYEFTEIATGSYSITVSKAEYTDLVDDYVIDVKDGKRMRRDVQIKKRPVALHLYDNESQEISELDFGANEGVTKKTFNIFNGGTKKIEYNIEKSVDWIIEISPSAGAIDVGMTKPIVVTINRRLLASGENTTTLLITSLSDGARELIVKATNAMELPTVNVLEVLELTESDSTIYRVKCEVETDGGSEVTERGICWNTYGDPTLDDNVIQHSTGGTGRYTVRMEHLALGKRYYVRAYAKNAADKIGYSEEVDFETDAPAGMPVEIELSCNPAEGGTVSGGGTYEAGTQCTVTATANTGYTFVSWTQNGSQVSSEASYTFLVTTDRTLVANFTKQAYVITTEVDPEDSGTVTGAGGYDYGEQCTLTATPKTGYDFQKWTKGGTTVFTEAEYTFTVNASATYVAHFKVKSYTVTVTANPGNGGTVSGGGTVNYGQSCTVHATANSGYAFTNWTDEGDEVSTDADYTFTVTSNRTLKANFTELQHDEYSISVSANPTAGGTVSGGGTYQQGQSCTVHATANSGYTFIKWTVNGSQVSTNADYTFTVTQNRTLVAHFQQQTGDQNFTVNGVSFTLKRVDGGTFWMGAQNTNSSGQNYDPDANSDESPVHSVTLSTFYMGETEVTQALWQAVMGSNPSNFTGDLQRPVEMVSWNDIVNEFIPALNALTGRTFRLPTEAEWEYAARGGNQNHGYYYAGSNTIGDVAWYNGNSSSQTHPVAAQSPNELGLYDMSGNVWEWCSDRYGSYSSGSQTNPQGPSSGSSRVLRGGSWINIAGRCRVSIWGYGDPGYRSGSLGFRLCLPQ